MSRYLAYCNKIKALRTGLSIYENLVCDKGRNSKSRAKVIF